MKKLFLLLLISFISSTMSAYDLLSGFSNITGLPGYAKIDSLQPLESIDAATRLSEKEFKDLKKKYKAKTITYELWPGGKYFYVLHKGDKSALLNEDFEPILLEDKNEGTSHYVYNLMPALYNGKTYIMGASKDYWCKGLYTAEGKQVMPMRTFREFAGFKVENDDYIIGYYNNGEFENFALALAAGNDFYWLGDVQSFRYYPANRDGYSILANGVKIEGPTHEAFFVINDKDTGLSYTFVRQVRNGKLYHKRLPRCYALPGAMHIVASDYPPVVHLDWSQNDSIAGSTSNKLMMTVNSYMPTKKTAVLCGLQDKVYTRGVSGFRISYPEQIVYTVKMVNGAFRKGAIDLKDSTFVVEPRFNDIRITKDSLGNRETWVKTSTFAEWKPISSIRKGARTMPKNKIDSLFEVRASEIQNFGITSSSTPPMEDVSKLIEKEIADGVASDVHLAMYLAGAQYDTRWYLKDAQSFIDDLNEMKDVRTDPRLKTYLKYDKYNRPRVNPVKYWFFKNQIDNLMKCNRSGMFADSAAVADDIENLNDIYNEVIRISTDELQAAYIPYVEEYNRRVAEQNAQRQEQIAMAVLNMMDHISENVVNLATRSSSSGSKGATTSSASKSTNGESSSSGESKADRKAFLRGEIIELKNKVKKAKASYEQAAENWASNGSWESKRAMESKKETLEDLESQLNAYTIELDNLK